MQFVVETRGSGRGSESVSRRARGLPRHFGVMVASAVVLAVARTAGAQEPPAPVALAPVVERAAKTVFAHVGTVAAARTSVLSAEVAGRIRTLDTEEGRHLHAGTPVALLDRQPTELELVEARATLAEREVELRELENGTRKEEIEISRARLASAEADHRFAVWDLERARTLVAKETVSEEVLKTAERALARAEAARAEAAAALELAVAGPREEKKAQAKARVETQRAAIARLDDRLARHDVKMPFDGWIVAKRTEVGAWVMGGAPIVEIVAVDEVDIEVPIPEEQFRFVGPGTPFTIAGTTMRGEPLPARVHAIVPKVDPRSRTVPVRLRVKNPMDGEQPRLVPGMSVEVTMDVTDGARWLLVPKDALVLGGPKPLVIVAAPGPNGALVAKPVPVETVGAEEGSIVVRGELGPTDQVVVRGNERLRPGQPLQVTGPQNGKAP